MGCLKEILLAVCTVAVFVGTAESGTQAFQCYRCKTCSGDAVCNRFPIETCDVNLQACGIVIAQKWGLYYVAKFCMDPLRSECDHGGQVWICDYHYLQCVWCCTTHALCNVKTPYPPKPTKPAPVPGEKGNVGPDGPTGIDGPPGPDGTDGPRGPPGADGPVGPPGPTGPHGDDGPQGIQGPGGPAGPVGPPGAEGPDGDRGVRGPKGVRGPPGGKGDKGYKGAKGTKGMVGVPGDTGLRGAKGIAGDSVPGDKGDQGDPGPEGPGVSTEPGEKGEKGNKGAMGAKGFKGDPGAEVPCDCPNRAIVCFTVVALNVVDAEDGSGVDAVIVEYNIAVFQIVLFTPLSPPAGGISGFGPLVNVGPAIFVAPTDGIFFFEVTSVSSALFATTIYIVHNGIVITNTGRNDPNGNIFPVGHVAIVLCLKQGDKVILERRLPFSGDSHHFGYGYGSYSQSFFGDPSRVTFSGCLMSPGHCTNFRW